MQARRTSSTAISIALTWLLAVTACTQPDDPAARAHAIERRILAPCCLRQTLEDHESEVAHGLRSEIDHRVAAGEPSAAIEDDLVRRYGDQVRAMPSSWDPRALLGVAVAGILVAGGLAVWWLTRRRRSAAAADAPPDDEEASAEYAARLDDDLLAVD